MNEIPSVGPFVGAVPEDRHAARVVGENEMNIPTGSTRSCEECGASFIKRLQQGAGVWLKRRFCSAACSQVARSKELQAARPDFRTAFESHIDKTEGCWLWRGAKPGHYGSFYYVNKRYPAHLVALKLDGRPVPEGQFGLHICDNKPCVRPSHLYVGTHAMNMVDAWERVRSDYGAKHHWAKLTLETVLEMRRMRDQGFSYAHIGRAFNVTFGAARCAVLGQTWKKSVPANTEALAHLKQVRPNFLKKSNTTGFRGVSPYRGRYRAVIASRLLGSFETPEEASAVFEAAAQGLYGPSYRKPLPLTRSE